jgi:hypothetical protein
VSVVRWRIGLSLLSALGMSSLVLCVPALAQSSPPAGQYVDCTSAADDVVECVGQSTADGTEAAANNVGQGTDTVNDAMSGTISSSTGTPASARASASPDVAATGSEANAADIASASEESGGKGERGGPASITELPETGGAPLAALGSGVLLTILGLTARGLAMR